jgi:hypothetical protein
MSKLGISARVIIAIAFLFCVFPEDSGIAADFVQPNEIFPAASAPEAVANGDVNQGGKNDIKVLPEESFPWPLFLPAIIAGKRTCPAIPNGDFESGRTLWSEYSELGYEIITNVLPTGFSPHSGSYAVWLGGEDNEISFIGQQVPISSSCPFLTFYHWINSSDLCGYDIGLVLINEIPVGTFELCEARNTGGWQVQSIDLSAYAGQTVNLIISTGTDDSFPSNWFIDDVSFQASAQ